MSEQTIEQKREALAKDINGEQQRISAEIAGVFEEYAPKIKRAEKLRRVGRVGAIAFFVSTACYVADRGYNAEDREGSIVQQYYQEYNQLGVLKLRANECPREYDGNYPAEVQAQIDLARRADFERQGRLEKAVAIAEKRVGELKNSPEVVEFNKKEAKMVRNTILGFGLGLLSFLGAGLARGYAFRNKIIRDARAHELNEEYLLKYDKYLKALDGLERIKGMEKKE